MKLIPWQRKPAFFYCPACRRQVDDSVVTGDQVHDRARGGCDEFVFPESESQNSEERGNMKGQNNSASRGYQVRNQAPNELGIWIYEEIGWTDWNGEGITAKQIVKDLQAAGNVKTINVYINSAGGRVFDALGIHSALRQHKATKNVSIQGLAASSASIVAMCGNNITMSSNSLLMIHSPFSLAMGTAEEFRKEADMLDKVEGSIIQTYLEQCRKSGHKDMGAGKIAGLMKAETWMNAEEALSYGFVDSITEALQAAACFDLSKFKYRKIPAAANRVDPMVTRTRLAAMSMECLRIH